MNYNIKLKQIMLKIIIIIITKSYVGMAVLEQIL